MGFFDRFRNKRGSGNARKKHAEFVEAVPTRHCFVLCSKPVPDDLTRATEIVARVFGRQYTTEVEDEQGLITVNHHDAAVGFLAHMPAPIPGGEAEAHAKGNFLWPQGEEKVAQHQSHVIVTCIGGEQQTPIQSALTVSRLALVALDLFEGIGVYWGNSSVCNSREIFEVVCENCSEEHVPVPVWLRFQLVRAEAEQFGMYTLGMKQFGLMDLEVDISPLDPEELFDFVANIAHYLIQSGPVIEDGNTVGGSEEERILVRHRPSMIEKDWQVYKIVFEG